MFRSIRPHTGRFTFNKQQLTYVDLEGSLESERTVEVPVADAFIDTQAEGRWLEVGNTLRQYQSAMHSTSQSFRERVIIDKFENAPGVQNIDLFDYKTKQQFQVILSISTVEHIGQGVDPQAAYGEKNTKRDREAPLVAIRTIYELLDEGGRALITVPYGKLLDGGWYIQFSFDYLSLLWKRYGIPREAIQCSALHRMYSLVAAGTFPQWREESLSKVALCEYNYPHNFANAVAVLEITKQRKAGVIQKKHVTEELLYTEPFR